MTKSSDAFRLTEKQDELLGLISGTAKHSLLYGGSRSGKTFLLCYAIAKRAVLAPGSRHAIFRRHGVAVKQSIGMDTLPKVLSLALPTVPYKEHNQDGYIELTNGSEIWLAGLDDKERVDKVLGKEFATLYFNEASEIPYQSYVVAQTRLAQQVKTLRGNMLPLRDYVDLNPTTKQHWTYKLFVEGVNPDGGKPVTRDDYMVGMANPQDNAENLSADYLLSLSELPERQRRRFFEGQYTGDVEDALWRREMIRKTWQDWQELNLRRVVVAIDPAASTEPGSDETGIVCAGVDRDGMGYILADDSGRYSPEEWARRALAVAEEFDADCIVAEKNNGGDMVGSVIRAQQRSAGPRVKLVSATRGKAVRAEPVAALYERGKIKHVGDFGQLEDQMCNFTVDFDRKAQGYSPDRVDALVWGVSELFNTMTPRGRADEIKYPQLANVA